MPTFYRGGKWWNKFILYVEKLPSDGVSVFLSRCFCVQCAPCWQFKKTSLLEVWYSLFSLGRPLRCGAEPSVIFLMLSASAISLSASSLIVSADSIRKTTRSRSRGSWVRRIRVFTSFRNRGDHIRQATGYGSKHLESFHFLPCLSERAASIPSWNLCCSSLASWLWGLSWSACSKLSATWR